MKFCISCNSKLGNTSKHNTCLKCRKSKPCEICGKETGKTSQSKICPECSRKNRKVVHIYECIICNKKFEPETNKNRLKKTCSKACLSILKSKNNKGNKNPAFGKVYKGVGFGKRIKYNGITFRSSYEYIRAKFLNKNNVKWKYEEKRYYLDNCSYLPDFFIYDANNTLIRIEEVKGWQTETFKNKIELFKNKFPEDYNLYCIVEKENLEKKIGINW